MRPWRWVAGLATLLLGRILRRRAAKRARSKARVPGATPGTTRELGGFSGPDATPDTSPEHAAAAAGGATPEHSAALASGAMPEPARHRRAELLVAALLLLAGLFAAGFVAVYGVFSVRALSNELLGACIAVSLIFGALALAVFAHRLVPEEELEEAYPEQHPREQRELAELIVHGGSRVTRRRLLLGAGAAAGGALGAAAITPALSLGPLWYTAPLSRAPWRRGSLLVDEQDRPLSAAEIAEGSFYTAFPQGADKQEIGSPVVVVRLAPAQLKLPPARATWAPLGILAFSKICTHAGCAIALYRKPTFRVVEPEPALVCPCHYSTFNPATGGTVIFGPAGRPLPQLPLLIDAAGYLRSAGNFSGPVGPSWWGVRMGRAR